MATDSNANNSSAGGGSADSPVGAGNYVVEEGDCLASIGFDQGFDWKFLWDHPANAAVKQARQSPYQLVPGDQLFIPPLRVTPAPAPSGARHTFKIKGVPAVVRLKILQVPKAPPPPPADPASQQSQEGAEFVVEEPEEHPQELEPAANLAYNSFIDDVIGPSGTTDGQGMLAIPILPGARQLLICLEPGQSTERDLTVMLGALDPIDTSTGLAQRLANLGYNVETGGSGGDSDDALQWAIELFQKTQGLSISGTADADTRDKLKELHGS